MIKFRVFAALNIMGVYIASVWMATPLGLKLLSGEGNWYDWFFVFLPVVCWFYLLHELNQQEPERASE